jgi:NAD(P)-dependent dehydrogenase (short-subunit alcohol dehydrogenase family)
VSKTIVITGAGDGLGRAMARRFAKDGDSVVLLGRTFAKVKAVADELGEQGLAIECDVTSADSVRAAFAEIARTHSAIDVLINNAAVYEPFSLAEVRDDQIMTQVMTNFVGPIFVTREALPLLKPAKGHIVNVSSESIHLRMPMLWLYAGTQAGLEYMSHEWERDLDQEGVRVTIVRAGMMMDETKTGSSWPIDAAMRFAQANAAVGLNLRERPISHYNSVADAVRAVIDTPSDVHIGLVTYSARRP